MKNQTSIGLWVGGAILLAAGGIGIWFLLSQTSYLSPTLSPGAVQRNNQNPLSDTANTNALATVDISQLAATTLIVPTDWRTGTFATDRKMLLPSGWTISLYASGFDAARFFDITENGSMVVADKGAGKLVLLTDADHNGQAESKVIDQGLQNVHSAQVFEGNLYVGQEDEVTIYRGFKKDGTYASKSRLLALPSGGNHVTRTVVIGPDRKLYVSVGSSCNLCEERDSRRAAVLVADLDGTNSRIFASGLRNSVGLAFRGNELWGVDNGRDLLGDDLPPEEVNVIGDGKNYGWPYCYGDTIANPEYASRADYCRSSTESPVFSMQAHSAPLGMAFAPESTVPGLAGKLVIAFHGSWNRTKKTGYKVVWVDPAKPGTATVNLVSGWLDDAGKVWGRPVGVGFGPDGALYISDDQAGAVYRVTAS